MKRTFLLTILICAVSAGIAIAGMELTSARVYKNQRDWGKALQWYDKAIEKDPTDLEAHEERGEVEQTLAAATSEADKATLKQSVTDKEHAQAEMYRRMVEDFKKATTPNSPADEGMVKKLKKKVDDILERTWTHFYADAVKNDTLYASARKDNKPDSLSKSYLQAALNDLDMAILVLPEKWNAYGFKAQMLGKMDSSAAAEKNWRLALAKIDSTDKSKLDSTARKDNEIGAAVAREAILIADYNAGRMNETVAMANDILKSEPRDVNALELKVASLRRMADDTTLAADRRAELEKETMTAARNMATAADDLMKQADELMKDKANAPKAAEAIKDASQMKAQALSELARDPSLTDADRNKMRADAVSALKKLLVARPNDPDIIYTIGQFNLQLGDTTAAIQSFNEYLKVNDQTAKDRAVNFALGSLYYDLGTPADLGKARDIFKKMTELDSTDGEAWVDYGKALVRLKDTEKGVEYIKKGQVFGGGQ